MQEFTVERGFVSIPDFIHSEDRRHLAEPDLLASLGYNLLEKLFNDSSRHTIEIFESAIEAVHRYIVVIRTPSASEHVACKSFFDFLELMRMYLPVIEKLNTVAASAIGWQRVAVPRAAAGERLVNH